MTDRRLVQHLALVALVKLALLAGLWWFFVRDLRIDPVATAAHLVATRAPAGAQGIQP